MSPEITWEVMGDKSVLGYTYEGEEIIIDALQDRAQCVKWNEPYREGRGWTVYNAASVTASSRALRRRHCASGAPAWMTCAPKRRHFETASSKPPTDSRNERPPANAGGSRMPAHGREDSEPPASARRSGLGAGLSPHAG